MSDLNQLILTGNLTRDPEVKYTPSGTAICSFGVASNRVWKDAQGNKMEETFFGDCIAYGRTAEVIKEHFPKGRKILVIGRIKTEKWDDKQTGAKRSATRIIVDNFQFMGDLRPGNAARNEEADSAAQRTQRPAAPPRPPADPDLDTAPDDIPF